MGSGNLFKQKRLIHKLDPYANAPEKWSAVDTSGPRVILELAESEEQQVLLVALCCLYFLNQFVRFIVFARHQSTQAKDAKDAVLQCLTIIAHKALSCGGADCAGGLWFLLWPSLKVFTWHGLSGAGVHVHASPGSSARSVGMYSECLGQ